MKHYGNITNINGAEVEPYPIAVTKSRFKVGKSTLARWEINEDGYYPYCTKCGKEPQDGKMTEICPNCKARMVNSNATDCR